MRTLRAKPLLIAAISAAIAAPVGFAVVGAVPHDIQPPDGSVTAAECPAAHDAWSSVGMPADTYGPGCMSGDEARKVAEDTAEWRERGLSRLAQHLREVGDPENDGELAYLEAELEQMHAAELR